MAKSHRFNVNFSEGAYRDLNALAERRGKTMSEVLHDALWLEGKLDSVRREGGKVLVERPDGSVREVDFR